MFVFKEFAMAFILENTKPFAESLIDEKKKKSVFGEQQLSKSSPQLYIKTEVWVSIRKPIWRY